MFLLGWLQRKCQFVMEGEPQHPDGLAAYVNYLRFLRSKFFSTMRSDQYDFESPFFDYLQAPLQPLADNLENTTYETFEKDPVKYQQYEEVDLIPSFLVLIRLFPFSFSLCLFADSILFLSMSCSIFFYFFVTAIFFSWIDHGPHSDRLYTERCWIDLERRRMATKYLLTPGLKLFSFLVLGVDR